MRSSLVVGNWKMHGSVAEVRQLLGRILAEAGDLPEAVEMGVCPTYLHLELAREILAGSAVKLGAQNAHAEPKGAFTGEVSASMLAEFGVTFVIVGHSERRELFHETDATVADKFKAVQANKLIPILCIGESLQQREQGITAQVVLNQLDAVIDATGIGAFAEAVVAYEPLWAIGTGKTASPEQAQQVHRLIREHLAGHSEDIAANTRILYGGSVKSGNAAELFSQLDVDGGLVGGASLQAEEFLAICKSAD
jgi:triosephosphate isomerase (TIM)